MPPRKRSRRYIWIGSLLAGALVTAALGNALLSGLCLWSAIITAIVAAVKSSPKPVAGVAGLGDDQPDDERETLRRRERARDRRREEEYYQAGFDAEQREHEDRGEV
ncbi:hypothetical protein [Amycolatopsis vancoresmycina]|uniref:Uncharacterized protein n=1 Tax=Amycolatopsis vancoresmycina DSM 44592 TaxID=1292037 RepID=R1GH57_9PSEU|nr:hypothetical protein [Amycolatopsis vancoresmycina]EOD70587.1 hypothetical protein H480_00290 [Amycolatopsis vancoresmycina DSM 44592]